MKEISFTKMDFNLVQFGIKDNHKPNNGEKNSVLNSFHCVKSVRIQVILVRIFCISSAYSVSFRIQSECGKMRTRITANTDTFYAVKDNHEFDSGKKHRLSYFCIFLTHALTLFPKRSIYTCFESILV